MIQCDHYTIRGAIGRGKVGKRCSREATRKDRRGNYCTQHANIRGGTVAILDQEAAR